VRLDFEAEVQREMDMGITHDDHPPHVTQSSGHITINHNHNGHTHTHAHDTQPLLSNDKVL
jgi:hypothetical protein